MSDTGPAPRTRSPSTAQRIVTMTNVVPPPLAELLAEAAGARLRLARSVPEGFVVTGLIVPLELRALAREMDRP